MKINGEECELVTSFDQLRSGMIVWVTPCACGAQRRHMLLGLSVGAVRRHSTGEVTMQPNFEAVPPHVCFDYPVPWVVSVRTVARGIVYRVVDPKLAQTTERKREAVRT